MPLKRAFDIAGSLAGITVSAVPCLVLAFAGAAVHKSSPFFVQERVGLNGKPFKMLKIKSLRDVYDGEGRLLPVPERTSKLGSFLRRTRLDEIPQFINVLKGDMSLVGPRPTIPADRVFGEKISNDKKRQSVRPGMTGLAQISGFNSLSNQERLVLDHQYIDSRSLKGDLIICLKTPLRILTGLRSSHYNIENGHNVNGVDAPTLAAARAESTSHPCREVLET